MDAAMVPTAGFAVCDTPAAAQMAIADANGRVVVKADGLAAGKGVFVCSSVAEAEAAVQACLIDRRFGTAGARVLVEERLEGPEVSLLALCDGEAVVPLAPARDHKRLGDGDAGPNTGGMGCYSPTPDVSRELVEQIVATVHRPVVNELARRDMPFRGCLYAGLMLTADGPKVLEFNVRFGDPEAQVLVPRLEGDLLDALQRCSSGGLLGSALGVSPRSCVTVVMAAPGYPDAPDDGIPIGGVDAAGSQEDVMVFHAGTAERGGQLVSSGGRVLNVTALGHDLADARRRVYAAVDAIEFPGEQHRTDIGAAAAVEQHA
jgi:phosphoribosylamine--glycine ligase